MCVHKYSKPNKLINKYEIHFVDNLVQVTLENKCIKGQVITHKERM